MKKIDQRDGNVIAIMSEREWRDLRNLAGVVEPDFEKISLREGIPSDEFDFSRASYRLRAVLARADQLMVGLESLKNGMAPIVNKPTELEPT